MATDRITRREAMKYAGVITLAARSWPVFSQEAATPIARGYGTDPNLLERVVTWPRTLTVPQLATIAVLSDIVIPAEPPYPSSSKLGVHDFVDEWISAPYPEMQKDRTLILRGLAALDDAMGYRQGGSFATASSTEQTVVFDTFCNTSGDEMEFARRLIGLICGGYYTTREGLAAIGYVGNVALASFPGAPPDVVRHLQDALTQL